MDYQVSYSSADIDDLTNQLAQEAEITFGQARKVLDLLHIDKLNENLQSMQAILNDEKAVNALGLSRELAHVRLQEMAATKGDLRQFRVGIKPTGKPAGMIA